MGAGVLRKAMVLNGTVEGWLTRELLHLCTLTKETLAIESEPIKTTLGDKVLHNRHR